MCEYNVGGMSVEELKDNIVSDNQKWKNMYQNVKNVSHDGVNYRLPSSVQREPNGNVISLCDGMGNLNIGDKRCMNSLTGDPNVVQFSSKFDRLDSSDSERDDVFLKQRHLQYRNGLGLVDSRIYNDQVIDCTEIHGDVATLPTSMSQMFSHQAPTVRYHKDDVHAYHPGEWYLGDNRDTNSEDDSDRSSCSSDDDDDFIRMISSSKTLGVVDNGYPRYSVYTENVRYFEDISSDSFSSGSSIADKGVPQGALLYQLASSSSSDASLNLPYQSSAPLDVCYDSIDRTVPREDNEDILDNNAHKGERNIDSPVGDINYATYSDDHVGPGGMVRSHSLAILGAAKEYLLTPNKFSSPDLQHVTSSLKKLDVSEKPGDCYSVPISENDHLVKTGKCQDCRNESVWDGTSADEYDDSDYDDDEGYLDRGGGKRRRDPSPSKRAPKQPKRQAGKDMSLIKSQAASYNKVETMPADSTTPPEEAATPPSGDTQECMISQISSSSDPSTEHQDDSDQNVSDRSITEDDTNVKTLAPTTSHKDTDLHLPLEPDELALCVGLIEKNILDGLDDVFGNSESLDFDGSAANHENILENPVLFAAETNANRCGLVYYRSLPVNQPTYSSADSDSVPSDNSMCAELNELVGISGSQSQQAFSDTYQSPHTSGSPNSFALESSPGPSNLISPQPGPSHASMSNTPVLTTLYEGKPHVTVGFHSQNSSLPSDPQHKERMSFSSQTSASDMDYPLIDYSNESLAHISDLSPSGSESQSSNKSLFYPITPTAVDSLRQHHAVQGIGEGGQISNQSSSTGNGGQAASQLGNSSQFVSLDHLLDTDPSDLPYPSSSAENVDTSFGIQLTSFDEFAPGQNLMSVTYVGIDAVADVSYEPEGQSTGSPPGITYTNLTEPNTVPAPACAAPINTYPVYNCTNVVLPKSDKIQQFGGNVNCEDFFAQQEKLICNFSDYVSHSVPQQVSDNLATPIYGLNTPEQGNEPSVSPPFYRHSAINPQTPTQAPVSSPTPCGSRSAQSLPSNNPTTQKDFIHQTFERPYGLHNNSVPHNRNVPPQSYGSNETIAQSNILSPTIESPLYTLIGPTPGPSTSRPILPLGDNTKYHTTQLRGNTASNSPPSESSSPGGYFLQLATTSNVAPSHSESRCTSSNPSIFPMPSLAFKPTTATSSLPSASPAVSLMPQLHPTTQEFELPMAPSEPRTSAPLDEAGVNLVELHKWAIGSDWKALVKPEKIYSRDQQGNTFLMQTSQRGKLWELYVIIEYLSSTNQLQKAMSEKNIKEDSVLHLAVKSNRPDSLALLLHHVCQLPALGSVLPVLLQHCGHCLHGAACMGDNWLKTVKVLTAAPIVNIDSRNEEDQTPIRCAVEAHRRLKLEEKEVLCTQVIAHLVSKGVDVLDRTGCMSDTRYTVIHDVIRTADVNLIRTVINTVPHDKRKDVLSKRDASGNEALHVLAENFFDHRKEQDLLHIVEFLVAQGADVTAKNDNKKPAEFPNIFKKVQQRIKALRSAAPRARKKQPRKKNLSL